MKKAFFIFANPGSTIKQFNPESLIRGSTKKQNAFSGIFNIGNGIIRIHK